MTIPRFTPGEITVPQAAGLNELARVAGQFSRLTVAAPLSLTRPAGIPAIRLDATGLGDLLAEITGNNGATPPVHTAKRKTRDTSNNVVDYSPAQTFDKVLNPQETAWSSGTLIELVKIPDWPGWYWGFAVGGGVVPPTLPCEPHDWLLDKLALISKKKYFDVQIFAGKGRCSCITEQGRDPGGFPYPWQAIYDADVGKWVLEEGLNTCCDCTRLELDVDDTTGTMTGQIIGDNSCDGSAPFTYDLITMCSGQGFVLFGAAGPKLCNTTLPTDCVDDDCSDAFLILVTCDCCDLVNSECDNCYESCAPSILRLPLTGFGGANTWLNQPWYLLYQGNCTWKDDCQDITAVVGIDGTNRGTITVTIGGVAVYQFTVTSDPYTNLIQCFAGHTLDRVSGDAGTTPATITEGAVFCQPCAACSNFMDLTATITSSDDCACMAGTYDLPVVTTTEGVQSWETDTPAFPCGGGVQRIFASCRCNSDGTSTISLTVICGASNTGAGSVTFATCDMASLSVTIPISMTDPLSCTCTGDCHYQYNAMLPGWQLLGNDCDCNGSPDPCDTCPETPVNPPGSPTDGQLYDEACTGGTDPDCCIGTIDVALAVSGGALRMEAAPKPLPLVSTATPKPKSKARTTLPLPCIHRGEATGQTVGCQTCKGNVQLKLYACAGGHGDCTLAKRVPGHGCCDGACAERSVDASA
jgi:hypothetical protein